MDKRLLALTAGAALVGSGAALAAPFNSFDPRSMAMGSTGVAAANPATAPFFNPATLAVAQEQDDFAMELPIAGARIYDPKDLVTGLKDFQDANLLGQITTTGRPHQEYSNLAEQLLTNAKTGFPAINDKPVQGELGVATVISVPSRRFGAALFANSWMAVGGTAALSDHDLNVLNEMRVVCDQTNLATYDPVQCTADANSFSSNSKLLLRGVSLSEIGVSMAGEFLIRGIPGPVALGVTPKYVKATTVDYSATVETANTADVKDPDFINEQSNFNLDIGAAKDFANGWRAGLVVKNIIPQEYEFKQFDRKSGTVKLNPQARVGASYQNSWFSGAMDVDLTENDPVGFEDKSRYIAIGTELNALDWAQLRLGYRINTVNSERNVTSAGVGLSPLGIHIDLAVAGNGNELGVAAQLGFRF